MHKFSNSESAKRTKKDIVFLVKLYKIQTQVFDPFEYVETF